MSTRAFSVPRGTILDCGSLALASLLLFDKSVSGPKRCLTDGGVKEKKLCSFFCCFSSCSHFKLLKISQSKAVFLEIFLYVEFLFIINS